MIDSITIKKVASFDDTGVQTSKLKKVNFFFGFNGSGKSTIANYLHSLGLPKAAKSTAFDYCFSSGYDPLNNRILTFNQTFVEENFIRNADLKGVFSLNKANAIIDNQIKDIEGQILAIEEQIKRYNFMEEKIIQDEKQKTEDLTDYCWRQRDPFSGYSKLDLDNSGSKTNHFQRIKDILRNPPLRIPLLADLNLEYQQLFEKEIKEVKTTLHAENYFEIRKIERRLNKLLSEVIVGKKDVAIADLIDTLNLNKWVETGVNYLTQTNEICPFCQKKTIDENLRVQFERFFDESYKQKIEELQNLKNIYSEVTDRYLANLNQVEIEFNPGNLVSSTHRVLWELYLNNLRIIDAKINSPNEIKKITSFSTQKSILVKINGNIFDNNENYSQLNAKRNEFTEKVWTFMAHQCQDRIINFKNRLIKYRRIRGSISNINTVRKSKAYLLWQSIDTLRNQTVNTTKAVKSINTILINSGYTGFQIEEGELKNNISYYTLKRPMDKTTNHIFKTLSEGEKSFIAFLYFYQLCIGIDDLISSHQKKIIVIDDPVSSLDSQALFIVSTLIHSLIRRNVADPQADKKQFDNPWIEQVFIFTHNFYFYKEVSLDKRPICTDYWHIFISKNGNRSILEEHYNRKVFDDYSLMWQTLKGIKLSAVNDQSLNIMISNTMRRILESYVNFMGIGKDSWASLNNEDMQDPTYLLKCAFISTINDESHGVGILDNVYYQKIISEQPQNLFTIFAAIFKKIGKEHYELMMNEKLV